MHGDNFTSARREMARDQVARTALPDAGMAPYKLIRLCTRAIITRLPFDYSQLPQPA